MLPDPILPAALLSLIVTIHCRQSTSYNRNRSSTSSSSTPSMVSLTILSTATSLYFKKHPITKYPPRKLSLSLSSTRQKLISSPTFTTLHVFSATEKPTPAIPSHESKSEDSDYKAEALAFCSNNIFNRSTVPYGNPFLKAGNRNIFEVQSDEKVARVSVDMPGVEKECVRIWFENGDLKIEGVEMAAEDGFDKMDKERRKYSITVEIFEPELLKMDEAVAQMKNGVLKMVIPKLNFEERILFTST